MNRRGFVIRGFASAACWQSSLFAQSAVRVQMEVIASTLEEAKAAIAAGADRVELAVDLQRGGITPEISLIQSVVKERIPVRVMLRENAGFSVASEEELRQLAAKARLIGRLPVNGIVLGFLKDGAVDGNALDGLLNAAPRLRMTFHNALERTTDPLAAIEELKRFPQVDTLLVHGHGATVEERAASLRQYADAWQDGQRKLLVNGYRAEEAVALHRLCPFITQFHFGSQVRTPEKPYPDGALDPAKIRALRAMLHVQKKS